MSQVSYLTWALGPSRLCFWHHSLLQDGSLQALNCLSLSPSHLKVFSIYDEGSNEVDAFVGLNECQCASKVPFSTTGLSRLYQSTSLRVRRARRASVYGTILQTKIKHEESHLARGHFFTLTALKFVSAYVCSLAEFTTNSFNYFQRRLRIKC